MTNVYFSKHLTAYKCWPELSAALNCLQIRYNLLPNTRDIWVRDFMPVVSSEGHAVSYTYAPDYLRHQSEYITDWREELSPSTLPHVNAGLILDGGNVILCGGKVILTDKIFCENPQLSHIEILRRLESAFQAEPVIIPWDRAEPYGHADGVVRHIGHSQVLLTNYGDFNPTFRKQLLDALKPHFEVLELHFSVLHPHKDNWAYINFLQADDKFILPRLNAPEDEQALAQISDCFHVPPANIRMVNISTLLRRGGGLNCVSWTIPPGILWHDFCYLFAGKNK